MSVKLERFHRGQVVIVDGKRVPMLEAFPMDGGKILLVFDHRIAIELEAGNYEVVIDFVAKVMKNVMNPVCGRTFNEMVEITGASTDDGEATQ